MPEYFMNKDKTWARLQWEQRRLTQEAYGAFFNEIAGILYTHDFLGLATSGCPEDEYEPETGTIIPRLHEANTQGELATVLEEEFSQWFDLKSPGPRERYAAVARDVWAAWRRYTEQ
ncbi:MAG TPA: hypothetical protein VIG44_14285 [Thermomicrobiales bacterium]|jgi:hypothetical protein